MADDLEILASGNFEILIHVALGVDDGTAWPGVAADQIRGMGKAFDEEASFKHKALPSKVAGSSCVSRFGGL